MSTESERVAEQYRRYVYPAPIPNLEQAIRDTGYHDFSDPALIRRKLWPRRSEPEALSILVAGCGSNQAAYYALRNPGCRVLGIDLSETSLAHQQLLKDKHDLGNLSLRQMSLGQVAELGESFDYIVSTGVLHHLPNPDAGLRALKTVLAPHGVAHVMVYGYWRRVGVYMLQEVFRTLGVEQTPAGVEQVKATLAELPGWHHVHSYMKGTEDLAYDAGLVDTFLHPQDRAYTVPQVLRFAADNGLKFQAWLDNLGYDPAAQLGREHPLFAAISAQPKEVQWHLVDLLMHHRGCHYALFCHPDKPEADYRLDFSDPGAGAPWLDYIPSVRAPVRVVEKANAAQGTPARLERKGQRFELGVQAASLYGMSNGQRSIRALLEAQPWYAGQEAQARETARAFFAQMADWDHLLFEIPAPSANPASLAVTSPDPICDPLAPALALREQGALAEARAWLREWLQAHPRDATALAQLAHVALFEQDVTRAQTALAAAEQIAPELSLVQRNRARLCLARRARRIRPTHRRRKTSPCSPPRCW